MTFELRSHTFEKNLIPPTYTHQGDNVSPPLRWRHAPPQTKSLALFCEDLTLPGQPWSHWLLYNMPPERRSLPQGIPATDILPDIGAQGRNDFGSLGYMGPCPPLGDVHIYHFRLYALEPEIILPPGLPRSNILQAIHPYVLDTTELIGIYHQSLPESEADHRSLMTLNPS